MFHHTRDAIEGNLAIVFTALAIARYVQTETEVSIRRIVKVLRPLQEITLTIAGQPHTAADLITPDAAAILSANYPPPDRGTKTVQVRPGRGSCRPSTRSHRTPAAPRPLRRGRPPPGATATDDATPRRRRNGPPGPGPDVPKTSLITESEDRIQSRGVYAISFVAFVHPTSCRPRRAASRSQAGQPGASGASSSTRSPPGHTALRNAFSASA